MQTTIHTGSDGNHVTVYDLGGRRIAVIDERISRSDLIRHGIMGADRRLLAKWVGCWGSNDQAHVNLPFRADTVIGEPHRGGMQQ